MEIIRTILVVLLFYCLGCKDIVKNKKELESAKILDLKTFKVIGEDKNLKCHLPDTVSLRDTLSGYLVYKSPLDTIPIDKKDIRYVELYFAKTKSYTPDFKNFKLKKVDTFLRVYDSLIPIYNITFKKKGYQFFEGFIEDNLYLNQGKDDSMLLKQRIEHLFYKVYIK